MIQDADDEIGLTNYVTVGVHGEKQESMESMEDNNFHAGSIAVQSSFVQSTSCKQLPW